jgi:hypothetical protein
VTDPTKAATASSPSFDHQPLFGQREPLETVTWRDYVPPPAFLNASWRVLSSGLRVPVLGPEIKEKGYGSKRRGHHDAQPANR